MGTIITLEGSRVSLLGITRGRVDVTRLLASFTARIALHVQLHHRRHVRLAVQTPCSYYLGVGQVLHL